LRSVRPAQELSPYHWPVLTQVLRQFIDGHPVNPGASLVHLDLSQRLSQIHTLAYLLHELLGVCRVFGRSRRRSRFGPSRRDFRGFTPSTRREGQFQLVVLPLAAHEITPPTCRSRSFGPSSAVPGSAYPFAASFNLAVPHEPRRQRGLLCPLLTSTTRSDHLTVVSVRVLRRGHAADLPR